MARKSRMSVLKRQRELQKAEKAARKRARRHGVPLAPEVEPRATVSPGDLSGEAEAEPGEAASDDDVDRERDTDGETAGEN